MILIGYDGSDDAKAAIAHAGLEASATTAAQQTTIGDAILDQAERLDADAIVLGSRGLTGLGSLLLGSVSHRVVQHADRTVIVVPATDVAERRRHRREAAERAVA